MDAGRSEPSHADVHHVPVLAREVLDYLGVRPDGRYVDCTAGYGGHAELIAAGLGQAGRLVAIDRDRAAVAYSAERLRIYGDRVAVVHANFADLQSVLDSAGIGAIDGALFDLGVSLPQLRDDVGRGFSFDRDAPLDMRMDEKEPTTAADVVNRWPEEELVRIFREYANERYARAIARAIVRIRARAPLETTGDLVSVVTGVVSRRRPPGGRRRNRHPATRVFQAVRMAVNSEIENLKRGFDAAVSAMDEGGRLCVISFHSVEHRTVKELIRDHSRPCICPPGTELCRCGSKRDLRTLTKRAVVPGETEVAANPRARSAQLRVAERLAVSA